MSHELDEPLIHSFGYEALPRCDCLTGPDMPGMPEQGDVVGTRFACAVLTQPAGLPCLTKQHARLSHSLLDISEAAMHH